MKKESEEWKKKSRELLKELGEKLIKTTMVAAISEIEKEFGDLISVDIEFKRKFEAVRKHIFDTGHKQIDKLKDELDNYDIIWNRYVLKMPVNLLT